MKMDKNMVVDMYGFESVSLGYASTGRVGGEKIG